MRQDGLGALHHGRVGRPQHVVCIDNHVDAPSGQFLFGKLVVGRRDSDDRGMGVLLAEARAEFLDVLAALVLGVDHDAVGAGRHVGMAAFQGVVDGLARDERFAARNHHEIVRNLGILARTDLGAEPFDGILGLDGVGPEQGVLLEAHLVLDDDRRNAEAFQGANRKAEVFHLSTGVTVEDYRLGRHFKSVVQVVQTGREVHRLDVRLALARGVGQRRRPHAVEFADAAIDFNARMFGDKARKAVVRFKDADDGLGRNQTAKRRESRLRSRAQGVNFFLQPGRSDAMRVGNLDDLPALGFHDLENLFTEILCRALLPVIAVDDVVGLVLLQVLDIAPLVLRDNLRDTLDVLDDVLALFVVQVRQTLVRRNRLVRKQTNHHVTILCPLVDDVDEAWVHNVTNHSKINRSTHKLFLKHNIS